MYWYWSLTILILRKKVWHRPWDDGGCGLDWAGPGSQDHERHYAMISDVSPSLSLSSSLSLSPRYWEYGAKKSQYITSPALSVCFEVEKWDVNEYGEARLRWQYNAESGRWWNVQQVWSFDPIFVFDPGIMVRSKVTQAMMEWWEAVWGLGELEQNMLIFNPHISSANLFLENSHAVLNYFSASYVICSKNNQDFFAFLSPTDEKMLTSWKHCINAFLVQMKTSIMTREMLKKCQVTDPKWIQKW